MLAQRKKKHSDFWYRLCDVTNKVYIFTSMFYNKEQAHVKQFYDKKLREY